MSINHYDSKTFMTSASMAYLTKLAHTLMHERAAKAFAECDISFMQWLVLRKLSEGAASTASDLCRAMRYDTGALTRLLDELEERGFIERERSRDDRRVVKLRLTASGRKRSVEFTPLVVDLLNGALASFSKAEFQELTRLLNKLTHTFNADEEAAPQISNRCRRSLSK